MMKMFNVKMFALALLLGATGQSFGYWYGISNNTGTPLVVKIQVEGGGYYFDLIEDNEREKYMFGGGDIARCLASIHATEFDENKKYRGPNPKFKDKNAREIKAMALETGDSIHTGEFHEAFYAVAEPHSIRYVKMVMEPKELYEATSKAARSLVDGIEILGCKGLELAMQTSPEAQVAAGGKGMLDNITNWFKADTTSDTAKLTKLLADLEKSLKTIGGQWKTIPVASAVKLVSEHKDLLKGSFATIEGRLKKGENKEAVKALNDFIAANKASEKEEEKGLFDTVKDWWNKDDKAGAALKLGSDKILESGKSLGTGKLPGSDKSIIESDSLLEEWEDLLRSDKEPGTLLESDARIQGCGACSVNTHMDISAPRPPVTKQPTTPTKAPAAPTAAQKKEQCALGLAKIAKASAELKGNTLCKGREFELIYAGKGVRVVGGKEIPQKYDDYIAITVLGE